MRSLRAGVGATRLEVARVELVVAEARRLLDQDVAPGDEHDLARHRLDRQEDLPAAGLAGLGEAHRLVVRDDRRRQAGLHRLQLAAAKRLAIDPHRAAIERLRRRGGAGREAHHIAGGAVDGLGAVEAIAIVGVEPQIERRRQHLLGLQQREGRPIAPHLVPLTENDSSSHSTPARSAKKRFSVTTSKPGSVVVGRKCCSIRASTTWRSRTRSSAARACWWRATISPTDSSVRPVTSLRSVTASARPSPKSRM